MNRTFHQKRLDDAREAAGRELGVGGAAQFDLLAARRAAHGRAERTNRRRIELDHLESAPTTQSPQPIASHPMAARHMRRLLVAVAAVAVAGLRPSTARALSLIHI